MTPRLPFALALALTLTLPLLLAAAPAALAAPGPGAVLKDREPQADEALRAAYERPFLELYVTLGRRYPHFALKGIDWRKVGDEFLPLSAKVKNDQEFGNLVVRLVARLQDSHAEVLPGMARLPEVSAPVWDVGISCLIDDRDRPVIFYVEKGSPAALAGIKPGTELVSINGKSAADVLDEDMKFMSTYTGFSSDRILRYSAVRMLGRQLRRATSVKLVVAPPNAANRNVELPATLGVRYIPRLPVAIPGIPDAADVSWKGLDGDVGYIYVRRVEPGLPTALDQAVKELADTRGLIIDVRGNTGGGFDQNRAVRNFNLNDPEETERTRYRGPIAVLIDEGTISAGEGWASWFMAKKRAKFYGSTTAGASGAKDTYRLTNGTYRVTFPTKAYNGFLDRPIERRGLEPDVPIRQNAKDLAAGRDTVLEAAKRDLLAARR